MLVEVRSVAGKSEHLKKAIGGKIPDMRVAIRKEEAALHVSDIEADIDAETVKGYILKARPNVKFDTLRVVVMRLGRGGNLTATITASKGVAEELARAGSLEVR